MGANESKPKNPIPKSGYPENRIHQEVQGVSIKVGSVIGVGKNDDWWSLSGIYQIRPWEIIWFNFETDVPEEVNWYLRRYVGCHRLSRNGHNYTFTDADPGEILMPWGHAINEIIVERERKRRTKKKPTLLDRQWPKHKSDIANGRVLIKKMKKQLHQEVTKWARNPLAFNLADEIKGMFTGASKPSLPSIKDLATELLKVFREIDPKNQEIRRLRERLFSAFAAGVASVVFDGYKPSVGRSGYEKVFFSRGKKYAKTLTRIQRYQLTIALIENDRHYGIAGFQPISYTKEMYRSRMNGNQLRDYIEQEFAHNEYFFRNAR